MSHTMPGPGDVLGHFRLIEQIGAGGMGIVYRARDERLDRDVAVKILNEQTLAESSSRQRFRHEALILGRLSHPNVETVYDFHAENGLDYLVLEYVAGQSLDERLKGEPLSEGEVTGLGLQLAHGLAAAHAQGVIHGDLKPSNLRVTPENVLKILDFGLAQLLATPDAKTVTDDDSGGAIAYGGTPPYMPPEQINGQAPDKRSDIYSAGIVLYEMATGSRPFPQRGGLLREAILYFPPPPVREKNQEISPRLAAVILRCLEKDAKKRYQSAQELAIELEQAVSGSTWSAAYWRTVFAMRRHPWWSAAALVVVLLGAGLAIRHRMQNRTPPRMSVVVAEFENRTGEQVFDQTPSELIATALGQSPQVYVFPSSRLPDVLTRMKVPATSAVDGKMAGEICTRESLQAVVSGSISKLGSSYLALVRVLDCNGDLILSTENRFTGPERLPPAIDEIAANIRHQWGESKEAIQQASQPLAVVTSSSLEAIKLYTSGKQQLYLGNFAPAVALFRKAVELDGDFAMAHQYLGTAYLHLSDGDRAGAEYAKAAQLSNRVTEKEREKILGDYALFQKDMAKAISHYQVLSVLSPDDPAVYVNLAECYRDEFRFDLAIVEAKKAVELTKSPSVETNLATYYYLNGNSEEALQQAQQVLRENPDNDKALNLTGSYYLGMGKEKEARVEWGKMLALGGNAASRAQSAMADAALTRDNPKEGATHLELGLIADSEMDNMYEKFRKQVWLAEIYQASGEQTAEAKLLREMREPAEPELVYLLGRAHARAGRISSAEEHVRRLDGWSYQTPNVLSFVNMLRAEIAMAQNRGGDAAQSAESGVEHLNSPLALETLARAEEAAGNREEAVRQYELLLARSHERQFDSVDFPAMHAVAEDQYRLGVLYQSLGRAEAAERQFRSLLNYASTDRKTGPRLEDAAKRLAEVTAKPAAPASQLPQHKEPTR